LQKIPDDRQQSMSELQADLMKFMGTNTEQLKVVQQQSSAAVMSAPNVVPFIEGQSTVVVNGENHTSDDPLADPIAETREKAEGGDADAQHELGWFYYDGYNCEQSFENAFYWFSKSAEQGNAESVFWLGSLYRTGQGVEQNDAEAMKLFRRGADLGHAASQSYLADMYEFGIGVDVDNDRAFTWHKKAAEKGHVISMSALGNFYESGLGVPADPKLSAKWYLAAAEKGHALSQNKIGSYYAKGYGVAQNLEEAATWYMCAAQQGNDEAKLNLGHCYANGDGVPVDEEEALRWMSYAAEAGIAEALNYMGYWNENGMMGLAQDYPAAFRWFSKSALKKDSWAQFKLGCLSAFGLGVPVNEKQALRCYEQSAKQGVRDAQYNLALCYRDGTGTEVDNDKYLEWLLKAGEQEFNLALLELGSYYEEKDCAEAIRWYKKAEDLGEQSATERLAILNRSETVRSII